VSAKNVCRSRSQEKDPFSVPPEGVEGEPLGEQTEALAVPSQHLQQIATLHVIQHTDHNLLCWRTLGIRFMANKSAFTADRGAPGVRSST
jgi:hypothetical protein